MSETSARHALPFLMAGQAQKEMTHNEALALIDLAMNASVVAKGLADPPPDPQNGQAWIVGNGATGAWAGREGALAGWTGGGWRFLTATEGMSVWITDSETRVIYASGGWIEGPVVAFPAGGMVIDAEARGTIAAVLQLLRRQGFTAG